MDYSRIKTAYKKVKVQKWVVLPFAIWAAICALGLEMNGKDVNYYRPKIGICAAIIVVYVLCKSVSKAKSMKYDELVSTLGSYGGDLLPKACSEFGVSLEDVDTLPETINGFYYYDFNKNEVVKPFPEGKKKNINGKDYYVNITDKFQRTVLMYTDSELLVYAFKFNTKDNLADEVWTARYNIMDVERIESVALNKIENAPFPFTPHYTGLGYLKFYLSNGCVFYIPFTEILPIGVDNLNKDLAERKNRS